MNFDTHVAEVQRGLYSSNASTHYQDFSAQRFSSLSNAEETSETRSIISISEAPPRMAHLK
jgi:hypothetical protein